MRTTANKNGFGQWTTPALVAGMVLLVWVNHTLLEHRYEIWLALSNADSAVPSRASIQGWDVARLIIGVLMLPSLGLLLWWAAIRGRPLHSWGGSTIGVFVLGLVSLGLHLYWMYDWSSERQLELPSAAVWIITVLSLNAPLYLAALAAVVLTRRLWLFHRRGESSP